MPVYNGSKFLKESIQSILNQTYIDFEFIILNDNSTDNSLQIIKEFQKVDNRIIIINQKKNIGPALLRNKGFELAKGAFIALMDADDVSENNRFEKQLCVFNNNNNIGVCGSWFTLFGENIIRKVITHSEFHEQIEVNFLEDCNIGNPTVMLRSEIAKKNAFDEKFVPIEDYQLWSILLEKTTFYNIQESLLNYRWHDSNISKTKTENILYNQDLIRKNLLKSFNFTDDEFQSNISVFKFEKKLKSEAIKLKLLLGKKLIYYNNQNSIYDKFYFEAKINEIAKKTISKAALYNFKFLYYLLTEEKKLFNDLQLKFKLKIIFKSIFFF